MLGCKGCHGDDLQGQNVTENEPQFGDMWAPNLTLLLASYSDADLEHVIRQGVPKDKREFWFMPSETFQYVSDADLAALVAYLRTVKPGGKQMPPIRKGRDRQDGRGGRGRPGAADDREIPQVDPGRPWRATCAGPLHRDDDLHRMSQQRAAGLSRLHARASTLPGL